MQAEEAELPQTGSESNPWSATARLCHNSRSVPVPARPSPIPRSPESSMVRKSAARFLFVVLFTATVLFCPGASAQDPNGALRGEVQDANAARIVGALVVAQSTGSSVIREATTDEQGEFRIEGLLPGTYRVTVTAKGFAQAIADVDVTVTTVRDVAVTLKPESLRETVNVQGNSSSITTQT